MKINSILIGIVKRKVKLNHLIPSQEIGLKSKTFGQLRRRVAFIARALRAHGVTKGDRVAG